MAPAECHAATVAQGKSALHACLTIGYEPNILNDEKKKVRGKPRTRDGGSAPRQTLGGRDGRATRKGPRELFSPKIDVGSGLKKDELMVGMACFRWRLFEGAR